MSNTAKNKGGRPEVKYPYLWELYHIQWERGDITEKNMMEWLGLKRTTLYKLSKKYKKEVYKNKKPNIPTIDKQQLVLEYILENRNYDENTYEEMFCIKHEEITRRLEMSSPTILKIIKQLESTGKIIKTGRGIWKMGT